MVCVANYLDDFREAVPGFSDASQWPEDVLEMALSEADCETGGRGWGQFQNCPKNFKRRGMFAYAAHWLTVNYPLGASNMANQSAAAGGAVASKSVGDESTSYATYSPRNLAEAGDSWLLTTAFGQQFVRLRRRAGMGARAV